MRGVTQPSKVPGKHEEGGPPQGMEDLFQADFLWLGFDWILLR